MLKILKRCEAIALALFIAFSVFGSHTPAYAASFDGIVSDGLSLTGGDLTIVLNQEGVLTGLIDPDGMNRLQTATQRPLISLYMQPGGVATPKGMKYNGDGIYEFTFEFTDQGAVKTITATVKAETKSRYVTFELAEIKNETDLFVRYFIWGPVPVNIKHTIADSLGVVYDDEYAVGLMSLNVKTVASMPMGVAEIIPRNNWHPVRFDNFRSAAIPIANGGQLRAYVGNFTEDRSLPYEGAQLYDIKALDPAVFGDDGQMEGSKIALYGCATDQVLGLVGEMEVAEGLPHPTTNGVWSKDPKNLINNSLRSQYLFATFDESTIQTRINEGRRMGADLLYGHDTFYSYCGDYRIKGFDTYEKFKTAITDVAAFKDMLVGTKNRPAFVDFVSPWSNGSENIDKYLVKKRTTTLATPIAATGNVTFSVASGTDFGSGNYVLVGNKEVMQVNTSGNNMTITSRAKQGTLAAEHAVGSEVSLLIKLPGSANAFAGNLVFHDLAISQLADSINTAGMSLSDMDGLEESAKTGHGWYMTDKTMDMWFNSINEESRDGVKAAGSGMDQWQWHIFSYQTWGEKYEDPTSLGQYNYRVGTNYDYFARNFFPTTLGLCGNTSTFTVEKAHFLGSKAAALNAQITIADEGMPAAIKNDVLDAYREWTSARDVNAFTLDQRMRMLPFENHFKLEVVEPGIEWKLNTLEQSGSDWQTAKSETAKAKGITNLASREGTSVSGESVSNGEALTDKSILGGFASAGDGAKWIQIDLGARQPIDQIRIWHDYESGRRYKDVAVALSNAEDFRSGTTTVFNNDSDNSLGLGIGQDKTYSETFVGKTIELDQTIQARYVRLWSNGWDDLGASGASNDYAEVQVISGTRTYASYLDRDGSSNNEPARENLSLTKGATVTTNATTIEYSNLIAAEDRSSALVDGNISSDYWVNFQGAKRWVQIDLGQSYWLNKLVVWHYHKDTRQTRAVVFQVSNDPSFATGVTTVFNNDGNNQNGQGAGTDIEYIEPPTGKEVEFKPVQGRYVRLWSNGTSTNANANFYVEVEAYGTLEKPDEVPPTPIPGAPVGLVLDLRMNELDGNAIINSVNGNTHEVSGVANLSASVDAKHGKALSLDGLTNFVDLGSNYLKSLGTNFTLQMWTRVKGYSTGDPTWFISRQRSGTGSTSDAMFSLFSDARTAYNRLRFSATTLDGAIEVPPGTKNNLALPLNEWHHIAVSKSGTNCLIYEDGELIFTGANVKEKAIADSDLHLLLGAQYSFAVSKFLYANADLDDVQIYNIALTQDQIKQTAGLTDVPGLWEKVSISNGEAVVKAKANTMFYAPPTTSDFTVEYSLDGGTTKTLLEPTGSSYDATSTEAKLTFEQIKNKSSAPVDALIIVTIGDVVIQETISIPSTPVKSVTGITLSETSLSLVAGEPKVFLEAIVLPEDADNKTVLWSSSDIAVAKVDANGYVSPVESGQATITATTVDGSFTAECQVSVVPYKDDLQKLYDKETVADSPAREIADYEELSYDAYAEALEDAKIVLDDSDATSKEIYDALEVLEHAIAALIPKVRVTKVSLDQNTLEILTSDPPVTLLTVIEPQNAGNKNLIWSSSDELVATVGDDGTVTPLDAGVATITVKTEDGGFEDYCDVKVTADNSALSSLFSAEKAKTLDPLIYPTSAWDAYEDAMDQAEFILANALATVKELSDSLKALEDAIANLVEMPALIGTATIDIQLPVVGDELHASISQGNASGALSFEWTVSGVLKGTQDTYVVEEDDIGKVLEVTISSALTLGVLASAPVIPAADKSSLKDLWSTQKAKGLDPKDYDAQIWLPYEEDLANAESVLEDKLASTAAVQAALQSLQQAVASLQIKLVGIALISNMAPKVGDTLIAELVNTNATGELSYAWIVGGLLKGSGNSYGTVASDAGLAIKVEISSANETGSVESQETSPVELSLPGVLEISVIPSTALVQKGEDQQFNATVDGQPSLDVTWEVQGNESSETTINSDGLLHVSEDETAAQLTVKAISTVDPSVWGTASIAITEPPTYGIEFHGIGASASFGSESIGYSPIDPIQAVIRNTGNQTATGLHVELVGDSAAFEVSETSLPDISPGGEASIQIGPSTGLLAGSYSATVTVKGDHEVIATLLVSFEVEEEPEVQPTLYKLLISPGIGGSITLGESGMYSEGNQVPVRAQANSGYQFYRWVSDVGEFANPWSAQTVFTMPAAEANAKAEFAPVPTPEPYWPAPAYNPTPSPKPTTPTPVPELATSVEPAPSATPKAQIAFVDVAKEDWFTESVQYAVANNLMVGTSATEFSPSVPATRAMVAAVLHRLQGSPDSLIPNAFADVPSSQWYAKSVLWANASQIAVGFDDGNFRPDQSISREQLATILHRYALKFSSLKEGSSNLSQYEDQANISSWANEAMSWAVGNGIIQGRTQTLLAPKEGATRAELAAVLQRFVEALKAMEEKA
ncbi:MAG: S-layer homology domain-containing protein [Clostridiales bacterium]|nr:S-layer homology domain-containing protein [Clostridiales bacterium]